MVVGWTTGIGYATDLGALLVAVNEGGGLRYVGKIGAGFNQQSRADLVQRLVPLGAAEPAVENPPTGQAATRGELGPARARHPRRIRRLDGRRQRPPGQLQGHRGRRRRRPTSSARCPDRSREFVPDGRVRGKRKRRRVPAPPLFGDFSAALRVGSCLAASRGRLPEHAPSRALRPPPRARPSGLRRGRRPAGSRMLRPRSGARRGAGRPGIGPSCGCPGRSPPGP